jgi:hypothetical protein
VLLLWLTKWFVLDLYSKGRRILGRSEQSQPYMFTFAQLLELDFTSFSSNFDRLFEEMICFIVYFSSSRIHIKRMIICIDPLAYFICTPPPEHILFTTTTSFPSTSRASPCLTPSTSHRFLHETVSHDTTFALINLPLPCRHHLST